MRRPILRLLFSAILTCVLGTPAVAQTTLLHVKKTDGTTVLKTQDDGGFAVLGTLNTGTLAESGSGTRLLWYPKKVSFRVGTAVGNEWNDANIGYYSVAFGDNVTASGIHSFVQGNGNIASGGYAAAFGQNNTVTGTLSFAVGSGHSVSTTYATAFGFTNTASNTYAFAAGNQNTASGIGAAVFGSENISGGNFSFVAGSQSSATGSNSTAIGLQVVANGHGSMALGNYASADGRSGTFVYGDNSTTTPVTPTAHNQFVVRATGGAIFSDTITSKVGGFKFPDGTIQTTASAGGLADNAVTSAKIANGAIINEDINASAAIADSKLATISAAGKVANSATSATATATNSAIVTRDANASFAARRVTLDTLVVNSGNALAADANNALQINAANGIVSSGVLGAGSVPDADAIVAGRSNLLWVPRRNAFRVGISDDPATDYALGNLGVSSAAFGVNTFASGIGTFVAGRNLSAVGTYSTVFGNAAATTAIGGGSFVFGDNTSDATVTSNAVNQFLVRASGGTRFYSNSDLTAGVSLATGSGSWAELSDVARKHLFEDISGEVVLAKIRSMPVREWSYKSETASIRHIGPTAQDFFKAFGLGTSDKTITTVDINGVNLLAAQALEQRTSKLQTEVQALRAQNETLLRRLEQLENLVKQTATEKQ